MLDSRSPRLSVGRSRDSKNRSSAYDHAIEATMVAMEAKRYAISSPKSQLAYTRAVNEEFMREQKQWREKARRKSLGLLLDQSKRQPSQVDKHEHLNGEYDPMSMIEQMIKSCMLSSRPNQSSQVIGNTIKPSIRIIPCTCTCIYFIFILYGFLWVYAPNNNLSLFLLKNYDRQLV